jgi:hypothetical protein
MTLAQIILIAKKARDAIEAAARVARPLRAWMLQRDRKRLAKVVEAMRKEGSNEDA